MARALAVALGALVVAISAPALAEEPRESYGRADMSQLPENLKVVPADAVVQSSPSADAPRPAQQKAKKKGINYKQILGGLVITRDLQVPGSAVAVRVLPTSSAIGGGSSAPIMVRPRVDGEGRYGFHMVASF
jgi:hypothetical protein